MSENCLFLFFKKFETFFIINNNLIILYRFQAWRSRERYSHSERDQTQIPPISQKHVHCQFKLLGHSGLVGLRLRHSDLRLHQDLALWRNPLQDCAFNSSQFAEIILFTINKQRNNSLNKRNKKHL